MRRLMLALGVSLTLVVGIAGTSAAADYQVIVNDSNPVTSMRAETVKRLMLKKTIRWDHGEAAKPVDQTQRSVVRAAFSKDILRKSISSVKAYWQTQIFSGRAVPPPEVESSKAVVEFVGRYPGAIGYVSPGTPLDGVKVVRIRQ